MVVPIKVFSFLEEGMALRLKDKSLWSACLHFPSSSRPRFVPLLPGFPSIHALATGTGKSGNEHLKMH